jgi:hypothetical protein
MVDGLVKNYYDSTIIILPDYTRGTILSGLSNLAAVAGIDLGQKSSTMIYEKLVLSDSVLMPVINNKYITEKYDHPVNLCRYSLRFFI